MSVPSLAEVIPLNTLRRKQVPFPTFGRQVEIALLFSTWTLCQWRLMFMGDSYPSTPHEGLLLLYSPVLFGVVSVIHPHFEHDSCHFVASVLSYNLYSLC